MIDAGEAEHFTYILKCADGSLYTGYATDLQRRLREHNGQEKTAGAKYTAGRRPVKLVYQEVFTTRSAAMQREAAIKQLSKKQKEVLIKSSTQGTTHRKKKPAA